MCIGNLFRNLLFQRHNKGSNPKKGKYSRPRKTGNSFTLVLAAVVFLQFVLPMDSFANSTVNGHWAENSINRMLSLGVFQDSNGKEPDRKITWAEFSAILNNVFGINTKTEISFSNLKENSWYSEIEKAIAAENPNEASKYSIDPEAYITRQDAIVSIGNVFELEQGNDVNFNDLKDISSYAKGYISAMQTLGYIKGNPNGCFYPKNFLTIAEASVLLDNIVGDIIIENQSDRIIHKNVLIVKKDVTLENIEVNGDLYITGGVEDGKVVLDTVKVTGRLVIQSGGTEPILLKNTYIDGDILINRNISQKPVNLEVSEDKKPEKTINLKIVAGTSSIINNSSESTALELTAKGKSVVTVYGLIDKIDVLDFSTVNIMKDSSVNKLGVKSGSSAYLMKGSSIRELSSESDSNLFIENNETTSEYKSVTAEELTAYLTASEGNNQSQNTANNEKSNNKKSSNKKNNNNNKNNDNSNNNSKDNDLDNNNNQNDSKNDTPSSGSDEPAGGSDEPAGGSDEPAGGNDEPAKEFNKGICIEDTTDPSKWLLSAQGITNIRRVTDIKLYESGCLLFDMTPSGWKGITKSIDIDFTTVDSIALAVYIPDQYTFDTFVVRLSSNEKDRNNTNNWVNFFESAGQRCSTNLHAGWNFVKIHKSQFKAVGDATWGNMKALRLVFNVPTHRYNYLFQKINEAPIEYTTIGIGGIYLNPEHGITKVLLNFDDSQPGLYSNGLPYMREKGIKGTLFVCREHVGDINKGYMTPEQHDEWYAAGNDIGNHSKTHADGCLQTKEELYHEYSTTLEWLLSRGYERGVYFVAYPQARYNKNVLEVVRDLGYKMGRGRNLAYIDEVLPNDILAIPTFEIKETTTLEDIINVIEGAIQRKSDVSIFTHDIADENPPSFSTTTEIFKGLIDYLVMKRDEGLIEVVTFSEYYDALPNKEIEVQEIITSTP